MFLGVVILVSFLVGCNTENVSSEEELNSELNKLSDSQLEVVVVEGETVETAEAVTGQSYYTQTKNDLRRRALAAKKLLVSRRGKEFSGLEAASVGKVEPLSKISCRNEGKKILVLNGEQQISVGNPLCTQEGTILWRKCVGGNSVQTMADNCHGYGCDVRTNECNLRPPTTPELVSAAEGQAEERMCLDRDGDNIYIKSKTSGWNADKTEIITSSDYCTDKDGGAELLTGSWIAEEQCDSEERVHAYYYECTTGTACRDGACVRVVDVMVPETTETDPVLATTSSCIDTDKGSEYFMKGTTGGLNINGVKVKRNDYCYDHLLNALPQNEGLGLAEFHCQNGVVGVSYDYLCPYGCRDGACISREEGKDAICSDKDKGPVDIYRKSWVELIGTTNSVLINEDKCIGSAKLLEKVCNSNHLDEVAIDCQSGCRDGACIR